MSTPYWQVELVEDAKTRGDSTADPEHDPLLHMRRDATELERDPPSGPSPQTDPAP
jgi:hypothetical protein